MVVEHELVDITLALSIVSHLFAAYTPSFI